MYRFYTVVGNLLKKQGKLFTYNKRIQKTVQKYQGSFCSVITTLTLDFIEGNRVSFADRIRPHDM